MFSAMFIFITKNFHSRCTWTKKTAPKNAVRKWVDIWCQFLERVMSLTSYYYQITYGGKWCLQKS